MLQFSFRRPLSLVAAGCLVASAVSTLVLSQFTPASAARTKAAKFAVCHRTNAIKNPYRLINVAWSSVDPNGTGHDNVSHDGPVFNVSNPIASHGTTPRDSGLGSEAGGSNNRWGDIFNAVKGPGNGNSNSNNWTTAGQAIFNGATFTIGSVTKKACRAMTATEFIKAEKEENPNRPMSQIMGDLDDQGASEDAALVQALGGGSFSSWYTANGGGSEDPNQVTSLIAAKNPSVTTEPPTNVLASSATLNGTITTQGTSMVWYFEWSSNVNWRNDPVNSGVTPNETNQSAATTTSGNVTAGITGLTSGTTYYYRTVGVATSGSAVDNTLVETYLYGVVKQFVFGAPAAPTINSLTCGNTKITVAFTANANVTNVTGYEYSVDGAAYQNSGVNGATLAGSASSSFDITGLTNGVNVLVAIRAITSSLKGIDSVAVVGSACGDPTPVTEAATHVQKESATINGTVTANGATTGVTFTWGTDSGLSGAATVTATPASLTPSDVLPVSYNLTGLTGGTTYYFRVTATRASGGPWNGQILSFVTPNVVLPETTTQAATSVTTTSATLNGTGTSNGATSSDTSNVTFKWGTDPTLTQNTVTAAAQNPLAYNANATSVSAALTNLTPYTTYYFRTFITRGSDTAQGAILSFTTLPEPPIAVTDPATSVTETTATLNGNGDPNLFTSDVTFEWGTNSSLSSNTQIVNAAETPLPVGSSPVPVTFNLTGLTGGTTYYFRVIVANPNGTSTGIIRSFTTLTPIAPSSGTTTTTVPAPTTTVPAPTTTVPAPTTTVPAPTTTAPTTVAPASTNEIGRVIGTAWFDTNRNNKRDSNEPLISSLPIELVPTGATAQSTNGVRKTALSLITGIDGSFDFISVVPGTYRIVGNLPTGYGIDKSWDTTGNDDWSVNVTVVAAKISRCDFAAVGSASMSGCYSGRVEASQLAVTWDGFDKKLGTTDDATFASPISNDCNFEIQGVPTGKFEVAAKNAEGAVVAKATMAVTPSGGTVRSASLRVNAKIQEVLPQTGSRQMSDLMVLAMYALVTGTAIVVTSRRRRRL